MRTRYPFPAALALALAVAVPAQNILYESMTGPAWRHDHAAPFWTDDVRETASYFGIADRLNAVSWFFYSRPAVVLEPGTYHATVWYKKLSAANHELRLTAKWREGASPKEATRVTPQNSVTLNTWLCTNTLVFTVGGSVPQPVNLTLHNLDSKSTMGRFLFDSFTLTRTVGGGQRWASAMAVWSRTGGSWSTVKIDGGRTCQTARIAAGTGTLTGADNLAAGRYRWCVRFRSLRGANTDLRLSVSGVPGGTPDLVFPRNCHTEQTWMTSPSHEFDVCSSNTRIDFRVTTGGNYEFADAYLFRDDDPTSEFRIYESMTGPDWKHDHGAPFWTDDVPWPASYFGKVDRLNVISWFNYSREIWLAPGTYRAHVWFAPVAPVVGRHDLRLSAGSVTAVTTVAQQNAVPNGTFRCTTPLTFTLNSPTAVNLRLHNIDSKSGMGRYLFDSFTLTRTADRSPFVGGERLIVGEPMTGWTPSVPGFWRGATDPATASCRVQEFYVPSSDMVLRRAITLDPGRYRAHFTFRKTVSASGTTNVTLYGPAQQVNTCAAHQPVGRWVTTRDMIVDVASRRTVTFFAGNPNSTTQKRNYQFGEFFLVRMPSSTDACYIPSGPYCADFGLAGVIPPRVGERTVVRLTRDNPEAAPFGATTLIVSFAKQNPPLPLRLFGINSPCSTAVQASPATSLHLSAGAMNGTVLEYGFSWPNIPGWVNAPHFLQAVQLARINGQPGVLTSSLLTGYLGAPR